MFLVSIVSFAPNGSAITFGTFGVNTGCGGSCDGYYANHFSARYNANDGPSGHYTTTNFQATLNASNQFGDRWTILRLDVYSMGDRIYQNTSKSADHRIEANSTYWQTIYASTRIAKGNNRVDFNLMYILKNSSGATKEIWYPIRRSQNVY